jgi:hypothetical protein
VVGSYSQRGASLLRPTKLVHRYENLNFEGGQSRLVLGDFPVLFATIRTDLKLKNRKPKGGIKNAKKAPRGFGAAATKLDGTRASQKAAELTAEDAEEK